MYPLPNWLLSIKNAISRHSPAKSQESAKVQVNLIITLSLGSTESDRVISVLCYNEVAYNRHIIKNHFGSHNWPCCFENCIIMRRVIMRLIVFVCGRCFPSP